MRAISRSTGFHITAINQDFNLIGLVDVSQQLYI